MMQHKVSTRAGNNQFKSIQQSKSNRIPVEFDLSAVGKANASSVCLLVIKLVLIALYYMFKQFTYINTYLYLLIT